MKKIFILIFLTWAGLAKGQDINTDYQSFRKDLLDGYQKYRKGVLDINPIMLRSIMASICKLFFFIIVLF